MRNANHTTPLWLTHLAERLQRGWRHWQYLRRRASAIQELQGLDDRALRDIGLERTQIRAVVEAMLAGEADATLRERPRRGHPRPIPARPGLRGRVAELG